MVVVAPAGDVDLDTAARLRAAFVEAIETGADAVVVDLADVGFMDSTGIGQLAWLAGTQRPGRLLVANARPLIRNALRLMGLDTLMNVHQYGDPPPVAGVTDTT
jgi:anti-anti-sigma factor